MASAPPTNAGQAYVQPQAGWTITVNGTDITDKIEPRAITISHSEKLGEAADTLSIEIDDSKGTIAIPPSGATIAITYGWARGSGVTVGLVGKGSFTADEPTWSGPPDKLSLTGKSANLITGYRRRKNATWVGQTLGAIVGQIAAGNGLTPKCHPSVAGTVVTSAEQANQSDMEFMRNLGRRYDCTATVKGGALIFQPMNAATTADGKTISTITISRPICATYSYSRPARDGGQDGAEAQYHDQAAGQRKTVSTGGTNPRRHKRVYASEQDASAAATSTKNRIERAKAKFEVTLAYGDATIHCGFLAVATGFKSEIDATKWKVTEVENTMGASGFSTKLVLEVAG